MADGAGSSNTRGVGTLCDDKAISLLTELCIDSELNLKKVNFIIKVLYETRVRFDESLPVTKDVLKKVSQLIASKKSPWVTVSLLTCLINNGSPQLLIDQCLSWMRYLCRVMSMEKGSSLLVLASKQMIKLIVLSVESNSLSRDVANEIIPVLLGSVLLEGSNTDKHPILYDNILKCMLLYPGPCGKYVSRINKLCLQQISSDSSGPKEKCYNCLSMAPFCESEGGVKLKFSERWVKYIELLKQNLEILTNVLFNIGSDLTINILGVKEITFPFEQPDRTMTITLWFNTILSVLNCLLMKRVPSTVHLPFQSLLELLSKLVNTMKIKISNNDNGIESAMLKIISPKIFTFILRLMNTITQQCKSSLVLHSHLLFTILLNIANCIKSNIQEFQTYPNVIIEFYEMLLSWLNHVGSFPKQYLQQILNIASSDINIVTSKSDNTPRKKSKQVLSKSMQADIEKSTSSFIIDCHTNAEIAALSWSLINAIINHTGPRIASKLQEQILINTIQVATHVLDCQGIQKNSMLIPPYGDDNCRLQLFRVVSSLGILYHPTSPSPTPLLVSLLKQGCRDSSQIIASHCQITLISMDAYLKPVTNYVRSYDAYSIEKERKQNEKATKDSALIVFPTKKDTVNGDTKEIENNQTSDTSVIITTSMDASLTYDLSLQSTVYPASQSNKRVVHAEDITYELSPKRGRTASPSEDAFNANNRIEKQESTSTTDEKSTINNVKQNENPLIADSLTATPPSDVLITTNSIKELDKAEDSNLPSLTLDNDSSSTNMFDIELNGNDTDLNDMLMTFVPAPPDSE